MNTKHLINFAGMQILWFGVITGAAQHKFWIAPLIFAIFAGWTLCMENQLNGDLKLMLVAVLIGLILDTSWIKLGWLQFSADWPTPHYAPLWILILWAGLALTLNHSLAWLQSKLWLAALLGGISSPLSYLAAAQLGAVTITAESWMWLAGVGISWAMVLPLLLSLAKALKQLEPVEHRYV